MRDAGLSVRARKSLGQNFLMHRATAERIADAARLSSGDTVFEIGPGTGMLTRALLSRAGKVIAVEADAALVEELKRTFAAEIAAGKLVLVHGDVRTFDFGSLPERYAVAANIPYYLTGELMRLLLSGAHKPESMTLLVQKEVAERIAREKKESLLSLSVKAYGTPKYEFTVPRGAFVPAPKVDSAVLSIRDISAGAFRDAEAETRYFALLHAGFAHKRKLLAKNLEAAAAKETVAAAFGALRIPELARAEDLPLAKWLALPAAMHTKER